MPPTASPTPSYEEALAHLDGLVNYERKPETMPVVKNLRLEGIRRFLALLGNPHHRYDTIHVAGTKGKGSTATMVAAFLQGTGLRVGLYTSPHLVSVRERIVLDGARLSRRRFCEGFAALRPALEQYARDSGERPLTYFDTLTALAFQVFAEDRVDAAVIEVGLGGRLDTTNVIRPSATAVTPISYDHMQQLGNTLALIAAEKGGLIKQGVPVVLGPQPEEADAVLARIASERSAPVRRVGADGLHGRSISKTPPAGGPQRIDLASWRASYRDVPFSLLGEHQVQNLVLALGLVETYLELRDRPPLPEALLRRACETLEMPGRVECIGRSPWTILDGAHNPASIRALIETIRSSFPFERSLLVFATARDKDAPAMLRLLAPLADEAIFTQTGNPRARAPEELSSIWKECAHRPALIERDPVRALALARERARPSDLICLTGSLYLAGRIRAHLLPGLQDRAGP
ncbi:MAG: folylpolyglutamate synthase/dihydrofolate synthase family protein [Planctomycetota bacterium]